MGWTSFDAFNCELDKRGRVDKKATMTAEIESWGDNTVIKAAMSGGNYYAVVRRNPDGMCGLVVYLIKVQDDEFWYKGMDDTLYPIVSDCPKSILDLADILCPPINDYARKWREECRKNLAEKKAKTTNPAAFRNVKPGGQVIWHVPKDSGLKFQDIELAGLPLVLTKVKGLRKWVHYDLVSFGVPTKYVDPKDCELVVA